MLIVIFDQPSGGNQPAIRMEVQGGRGALGPVQCARCIRRLRRVGRRNGARCGWRWRRLVLVQSSSLLPTPTVHSSTLCRQVCNTSREVHMYHPGMPSAPLTGHCTALAVAMLCREALLWAWHAWAWPCVTSKAIAERHPTQTAGMRPARGTARSSGGCVCLRSHARTEPNRCNNEGHCAASEEEEMRERIGEIGQGRSRSRGVRAVFRTLCSGTPPVRFRPIATERLNGRRLANAMEELGWTDLGTS